MSNALRRLICCWIAFGTLTYAVHLPAQQAGQGQAQAAKPDSPQVQADIEKAKALAGKTWALEEHVICDLPMISPAVDPGPQKLFDNLYAIPGAYSAGSGVVYLITTPAGIIQIDSGLQKDVETVYLTGMKKLGFDPADVNQLGSFRSKFNVPAAVQIVGPWNGQLDNAGETIELQAPDVPTVLAKAG